MATPKGSAPDPSGTERGNWWSITYFPPDDIAMGSEEVCKSHCDAWMLRQLPQGWKIEGQMERCPDTQRLHIQACLRTPQTRCSTVRHNFPRCKVLIAIKPIALQQYVHKEDTRVAELAKHEEMTIWAFSEKIASEWKNETFHELTKNISFEDLIKGKKDEMALCYMDSIVSDLIVSGVRGAEFMGVNPMLRSAWKKYWKAILARESKKRELPRLEISDIFEDSESAT